METEQAQVFIQNVSQYKPLNDNDTLIYEQYKNSIDQKIRETFPSIPSNFDLKPVRVFRMQGCGTFFHYKVALADNKFAKVSFHTGGDYMPPPGVKDYKPPEPTFIVDPKTTSTPDE